MHRKSEEGVQFMGGRGGKRPGAGRKPGSRNKSKTAKAVYARAELALAGIDAPAFEGDALALLVWCYKNMTLPVGFRADCAKAALPFEKPRLSATELTGKGGGPVLLEQIATAAMASIEKDRAEEPAPVDVPVVVH
jgi:hypothetical protein